MKNTYFYLLLLFTSFTSFSQCLTNGDLESGTSGWTFTSRAQAFNVANCNINTQDGSFSPASISTVANQFNAVNGTVVSGTGNDPFLLTCTPAASVPVVAQGSGAIKLNNFKGNANIVSMKQALGSGTSQVSFSYSLIIENTHFDPPGGKPFFTARVVNASGQVVNTNEICIKEELNSPVFSITANHGKQYLYTGWRCDMLSIPPQYAEDDLWLEFVVGDCGDTKEFGTVYIDGIDCVKECNDRPLGYVMLDPASAECLNKDITVCGKFLAPKSTTLDSIELWIMQNGVVVTVLTGPTISGNDFCFAVSLSDFVGNTGNYELYANAIFDTGSAFITLFDQSAVPGPDVSFGGTINSWDIDGSTLTWNDVDSVYYLEFTTEDSCCPGNCSKSGETYTVTVTNNSIDLWEPTLALQSKCFKWRVKGKCGDKWTQWCCLASDNGYGFLPDDQFGNPYAPDCGPSGEPHIKPEIGFYPLAPVVCPYEDIEVCLGFALPCDASVVSIELQVIQAGVIVTTLTTPSVNSNGVVCFIVSPEDFGVNPSGEFDFKVYMEFTDGVNIMNMDDEISGSVSFPVLSVTSWYIASNNLLWDDVAGPDTYDLEFTTEDSCCPGNCPAQGITIPMTVPGNSVNLHEVSKALDGDCFKWRVKPSHCGQWTEWCCIASDKGADLPPGQLYANPYAPDCFPEEFQGSATLYPVEQVSCPHEVLTVCGEFDDPCFSTIDAFYLELIESGTNNSINILTNVVITGNTFCFDVLPSDFGAFPQGDIDFKVIIDYNVGGTILTRTDYIDAYVTFEQLQVGAWHATGDILYWEDIADSYIIQFGGDYECCTPLSAPNTGNQAYYTTSNNYFDLASVSMELVNKCFGWRVKPEHCGKWTDWCCISIFNTEDGEWFVPNGACWAPENGRKAMASGEDEAASKSYTVYPNPVSNVLTIVTEVPGKSFVITDVAGKQLMDVQNVQGLNEMQIDLSGFASGMYLLFIDGNTVEKIMKD